MGTSNYSDEFKRDAVHPRLRKALRSNVPRGGITVRGYQVREVSQRLGGSTHSLCKWM